MNKLNKIVTSVAFAASLFAGNAMAASDGTLGTSSAGSSVVSLQIQPLVQITGMTDIALGAWTGTSSMSGSTNFCVYRTNAGNYSVTATTDTGAFKVSSTTASSSIPFTAKVTDTANSVSAALGYNTTTSASLAASNTVACGGGTNAQLQVNFTQANLQAAPVANDYQATVTLTVAPI